MGLDIVYLEEISDFTPELIAALARMRIKSAKPKRNPPMKINMLLHFYAIVGPYTPEASRTSAAYTQFVKELLRDGLIERPTKAERRAHPGWAYKTTAKGNALVNAICTVPNPVERTRWIIPS